MATTRTIALEVALGWSHAQVEDCDGCCFEKISVW